MLDTAYLGETQVGACAEGSFRWRVESVPMGADCTDFTDVAFWCWFR